MEFFGWLTKGKRFVSLLDIIIMFAEIGLLVIAFVFIQVLITKIKSKIKK